LYLSPDFFSTHSLSIVPALFQTGQIRTGKTIAVNHLLPLFKFMKQLRGIYPFPKEPLPSRRVLNFMILNMIMNAVVSAIMKDIESPPKNDTPVPFSNNYQG
jgi:hypothetical protein